MKTIIVNNQAVAVDAEVLSYRAICTLAGVPAEAEPQVTYRTYSGAGGVLEPGDALGIAGGLIISVALWSLAQKGARSDE